MIATCFVKFRLSCFIFLTPLDIFLLCLIYHSLCPPRARQEVRNAVKAARAEAAAHFTPVLLDAAQRALANPRAKLNSKWVQQTHEAVQVCRAAAAPVGRR